MMRNLLSGVLVYGAPLFMLWFWGMSTVGDDGPRMLLVSPMAGFTTTLLV